MAAHKPPNYPGLTGWRLTIPDEVIALSVVGFGAIVLHNSFEKQNYENHPKRSNRRNRHFAGLFNSVIRDEGLKLSVQCSNVVLSWPSTNDEIPVL